MHFQIILLEFVFVLIFGFSPISIAVFLDLQDQPLNTVPISTDLTKSSTLLPPFLCSGCPEVMGIMVDASPGAVGSEPNNEFMMLWSGGGFAVDDLVVDINNNGSPSEENPGAGGPCPFVMPGTLPAALQTVISNIQIIGSCASSNVIHAGPGDVIPAGAVVIVFTSYALNVDYSFDGICAQGIDVYLLISSCVRTSDSFWNSISAGCDCATGNPLYGYTAGACSEFVGYLCCTFPLADPNTETIYLFPQIGTVLSWVLDVGFDGPDYSLIYNFPSEPIISITPLGPFCLNEPPGVFAVTPTGGIWSGNGIIDMSSGTFDPQTAGPGSHWISYDYIDSSMCHEVVDSLQVVVNESPVISASPAGPFCINDPVTIMAATFPGTTVASWNGEGITNTSTGDYDPGIAGVGVDTVILTVMEGLCSSYDTILVTVNDTPTVSIAQSGPYCSNEAVDTLVVTHNGSSGTWGVGVDTAGAFNPATAAIGLNQVWFTSTSAAGCTNTDTIELVVNAAPVILVDSIIHESLPGANDGSIYITGTEGTGVFTFDWDNDGTGDNDDNEDLTNLGPGTYAVTIYDSNTCLDTMLFSLFVLDSIADCLETEGIPTHTTCGNDNGMITIHATGGTGMINFDIGDGPQFDSVFVGLASGFYSITVSDAASCDTILDIEIEASDGPGIGFIIEPDHCSSGNGSVFFEGFGGTSPYTYSFNGAPCITQDMYFDLVSEYYVAAVCDANGCIVEEEIYISDLTLVIDSLITTDASCNGSLGSIQVYASSLESLEYSLDGSTWQPSDSFEGLTGGNYLIHVRDGLGCLEMVQATIGSEGGPVIDSVSIIDGSCNLTAGTIEIYATAAEGELQYSINNGLITTNSVFTGLGAGNYTIVVNDDSNCPTQTNVEVTLPVNDTSRVQESICNGDVYIVGLDTFIISGLYTITFSDAHPPDCDSIVLLDLLVEDCCIASEFSLSKTICTGETYTINNMTYDTTGVYRDTLVGQATSGCDSVIVLDLVLGDMIPRQVDAGICSGDTFEFYGRSVLTPGTFEEILVSSMGCDTLVTLNLILHAHPVVSIALTDPDCSDANSGSIIVTDIIDGLPPFMYSLDGIFYQSDPEFKRLNGGQYHLYVRDANGCHWQDEVFLKTCSDSPGAKIYVPNVFSPNNDEINDWITVFADVEVVSIQHFNIFDRWGSLVFSQKDFQPNDQTFGWDGKFRNEFMNQGVYIYVLLAELRDGKMVTQTGNITLLK